MIAAGLAATPVAPARAADASAWVEDSHSALRLIAGANKASATSLRAGIEIKMPPGWHTYWRYPGDSGVPPRFDFSGSDNLAAAKVLYPAPHLYSDEGGNTIGYKDAVIFPLQVTPKQPGKPVKLHVKLDYAVCDKLCVPAQGSAELTLSPGASAQRCRARRRRSARAQAGFGRRASGLTVTPRERRAQAAGLRRSRRRRPARTCRSSSKGRRRNGRCRSRSRRQARPPATGNSASNSTACRPASIRRAISN